MNTDNSLDSESHYDNFDENSIGSEGDLSTYGTDSISSEFDTPSILELPIEEMKIQYALRHKNKKVTNKKPFDIDFIGNGPHNVTQLNLLQRRSVDVKNYDAKLSARGMSHRDQDYFSKDLLNSTIVINNQVRITKREGKGGKPSPLLLTPYFQRGIAQEKLKEIDKAIDDYTACINIDPKFAPAYFNRAGMYNSKGMMEEALSDLSQAIFIDPSNVKYRENRALLYRNKGSFLHAIRETMISKAIKTQPFVIKELKAGFIIYVFVYNAIIIITIIIIIII
jgi:tetratricopeptide (TPR) repeat protein